MLLIKDYVSYNISVVTIVKFSNRFNENLFNVDKRNFMDSRKLNSNDINSIQYGGIKKFCLVDIFRCEGIETFLDKKLSHYFDQNI